MSGKLMRSLDLYSKIPKDLTEATPQGGTFSIFAGVCMVVLFYIEFYTFINPPWETQVVVHRPQPMMQIKFNISMLDLPCEYASVDVLDILGTNRMNVTKNIDRWRLSPNGVRGAYQGKNIVQKQIVMFDDQHVDIDALHANGVHAVPLTDLTFLIWLEEHDYTFVDFYAPWCIWCRKVAPTWEALAEETERLNLPISVVQVNCDEYKNLCAQSKIQAFPTMRLFHRMESMVDYSGDRTVKAFINFITNASSASRTKGNQGLTGEMKLVGAHDLNWPGCIVSGTLLVNQVPGNFHIEAKSANHDFNAKMTNLSHVVNLFRIGDDLSPQVSRRLTKLPEKYVQVAPLDNEAFIVNSYHQAPHHFIKIVGTEYHLTKNQRGIHYGFQLLSHDQVMHYPEYSVPEAKFSFDISPMAVKVLRRERRWYSFITHVLALVGGTFSVMGLVDAFFWRARGSRKAKRHTIVR